MKKVNFRLFLTVLRRFAYRLARKGGALEEIQFKTNMDYIEHTVSLSKFCMMYLDESQIMKICDSTRISGSQQSQHAGNMQYE